MKKYLICLAVVMTVCAYARPVIVRYPGLIESAVGLVADTVGLVTGRTVVYDYGPGVVYQPPVQVAPAVYARLRLCRIRHRYINRWFLVRHPSPLLLL